MEAGSPKRQKMDTAAVDLVSDERNADDSALQCGVCCGKRYIPGLGDCPNCVTDVQIMETSATSSSAWSPKAIDVDATKPCDVCRGSLRVVGLGDCPKCVSRPRKHNWVESQSSQLQVKADRAVAELLETTEKKEARIRALTLERDEVCKRVKAGGSDAWVHLATIDEDVSDENNVRAFFERRQQGNPTMKILQCMKVENHRLRAFAPQAGNRPTLIFHGTPENNVGNIMLEGLLMEFCGGCGGIFGAMNPQTSLGYAAKAGGQRHFMAVCVYDLPLNGAPPQAGAAYSVPRDDGVAVLWLLKVAPST